MLSQATIERLDGYQGELARGLQKLEMERALGTLHADEQMDFIQDLREAMRLREQGPFRLRRTRLAFTALTFTLAALGVPLLDPHTGWPWQVGFAVAALAALAGAVLCHALAIRCRRRGEALLAPLEEALRQGRTLFDA